MDYRTTGNVTLGLDLTQPSRNGQNLGLPFANGTASSVTTSPAAPRRSFRAETYFLEMVTNFAPRTRVVTTQGSPLVRSQKRGFIFIARTILPNRFTKS
ncbi:hypothetical protein EV281_1021040 [Rhizobium sp. BK418]|nr:hypothetical protein EV281_1021040 [Rhizobium sp. BK418]